MNFGYIFNIKLFKNNAVFYEQENFQTLKLHGEYVNDTTMPPCTSLRCHVFC